jgi:hypothetical protein
VKGLGKNGFDYTFRLSQPVDASGQLANGEKFQDVIGLKRALLKNQRQIARNMVRQFILYGTGAPAESRDRAEVERILDAAQRDGYGIRTLIHGIVQSEVFRSK